LNFASAKNPGGGFLSGAMAQEEAMAASSGLYSTQLPHETYYQIVFAVLDHSKDQSNISVFKDSL
jgi:hypothetical protein